MTCYFCNSVIRDWLPVGRICGGCMDKFKGASVSGSEREDVLDSLLFYIHDADHIGSFDERLYPGGYVEVGVIDCQRAADEIRRLRAAAPEKHTDHSRPCPTCGAYQMVEGERPGGSMTARSVVNGQPMIFDERLDEWVLDKTGGRRVRPFRALLLELWPWVALLAIAGAAFVIAGVMR